jgi:hypothetical protein
MGVKAFAAKVGMASPNVLRALIPRHNPTQDTPNRLLKPFRLKLSLARHNALALPDRPRARRETGNLKGPSSEVEIGGAARI